MAKKFTLAIVLGNEAMQNEFDIGYALKRVAEDLADQDNYAIAINAKRSILDDNGNTVGQWEIR